MAAEARFGSDEPSCLYRERTIRWPGLVATYSVIPPHEPPDRGTVSAPGTFGVAFSAHRAATVEVDGATREVDTVPGTAGIVSDLPIHWLRVREVTECVTVRPDPGFLAAVATASGRGSTVRFEPRRSLRDPVFLNLASIVRRQAVGHRHVSDVEQSTLARLLIANLVGRYAGPGPKPDRQTQGQIAAGRLRRVTDYIEANLCRRIGLEDLADVAALSPFHFARSFARATGSPPHDYVTARRMERARLLLTTTGEPVAAIAERLGFRNLGHFRRLFLRHHGVRPGDVRQRRN